MWEKSARGMKITLTLPERVSPIKETRALIGRGEKENMEHHSWRIRKPNGTPCGQRLRASRRHRASNVVRLGPHAWPTIASSAC